MIRFVPPAPRDFGLLARNLRDEDLVESVLISGRAPRASLTPELMKCPNSALSLTSEHGLVGMCGVKPTELGSTTGYAWFLSTPQIVRSAKSLLQESPKYLDILAEPYPGGLVSLLWSGNPMHLKWAQAVDFEVIGERTIRGETFYIIHRKP